MYDANFELYRVKNYDFTGAESWTILVRNMGRIETSLGQVYYKTVNNIRSCDVMLGSIVLFCSLISVISYSEGHWRVLTPFVFLLFLQLSLLGAPETPVTSPSSNLLFRIIRHIVQQQQQYFISPHNYYNRKYKYIHAPNITSADVVALYVDHAI